MQIESLKVFCDLVETESFTKAAAINRITQSAVSQQITAMERLFKTQLVERSKRLFRLTQEGQILYNYSKQIVHDFDSLHNKLQETKDTISGNIRVSTVYSIGLHDLPPYLRKYLKAFPTVNVHVEYRRSNQVYEDVLNNTVDLGLVAFPHKTEKVEIIPLHEYKMVLICHPKNPLASRKKIRIRELAGQKFVSFEADMPTRLAIDRLLRKEGTTVVHAMEFDNVETVKQAVEIDAGIAIVPQNTVTQEVASHTLAEVHFDGTEVNRPWAAIYKSKKVLSPGMKQFIETLKGQP
jgi:DNA-binding transcriptional LysR family regulator